MKNFFSHYGWAIIEGICGFLILGMFIGLLSNSIMINSFSFSTLNQSVEGANIHYTIPTVQENDFVVDNAILDKNSIFDWKNYIHVQSSESHDLINYISVDGEVNTSQEGTYELKFSLNWNGKNIVKKATYYVKE